MALDSGVSPDPASARDRPRGDGGKRRRRGVAASKRAGMGLANHVTIELDAMRVRDFSVARGKR